MSKKKKMNFGNYKIFILVGAIGAAVAAAVLGLLYFSLGQSKAKQEYPDLHLDDQEPSGEPKT